MKKVQRLLSCVAAVALLAACTSTRGAIKLEDDPVRRGGVVGAGWLEESEVPAAAEIPETPPALGPSASPQIILAESDTVFLVFWGNKCRPDVTVGGHVLTIGGMGSPSEFWVEVGVTWDNADSCRGEINEWFARVEVEEFIDASVAQVAYNRLDGFQSDR